MTARRSINAPWLSSSRLKRWSYDDKKRSEDYKKKWSLWG
jgi:hypothetical protein